MSFPIVVVVTVLLIAGGLWFRSKESGKYQFPPGPQADLILGHLRIIPGEGQAEIFHQWAKTYGRFH